MDGSSHTSVAAALSLGGLGVSTQRVQVTSARSRWLPGHQQMLFPPPGLERTLWQSHHQKS